MLPSPNNCSAFPADPVLGCEVPVIMKIIRDETWLESERRGCPVAANDRVVKDNVCRVVLRVGQQLRDAIEKQLAEVERAGREPEARGQLTEAGRQRTENSERTTGALVSG